MHQNVVIVNMKWIIKVGNIEHVCTTKEETKNMDKRKKFGSKHVWSYLASTQYVTIEETIYV